MNFNSQTLLPENSAKTICFPRKNCFGLFPADVREVLKECIQRVPVHNVIKETLGEHTSILEAGSSMEGVWRAFKNAF